MNTAHPRHRGQSLSVLGLVAVVLVGAKPSPEPLVQRVPSIEDVVENEGFTPTPSQSEIYRPGAVLVPNAKGGHDVIVDECTGVAPKVSLMAQSSIATSLSAGVSARLAVARVSSSGAIEKRLSFVDPEQRTIPMAQLTATDACTSGVRNASRFTDLSRGLVIYDVLVAQIKNSVCTRADATGRVVALAEAEAAGFSECIQESDAQVPLGYKAVPLGQLVSLSAPSPTPTSGSTVNPTKPTAAWAGSTGFEGAGDLAKQLEAAAKLRADLEAKLIACLRAEAAKVHAQATADWAQLGPLVTKTDAATKAAAKHYFERFVSTYAATKVSCSNDLGERSEIVDIGEVSKARAWLAAPATSTAPVKPTSPQSSKNSPGVASPIFGTIVLEVGTDGDELERNESLAAAQNGGFNRLSELEALRAGRSMSDDQLAQWLLQHADLCYGLYLQGGGDQYREKALASYGEFASGFPRKPRHDAASYNAAALALSGGDVAGAYAGALDFFKAYGRDKGDSKYLPYAYLILAEALVLRGEWENAEKAIGFSGGVVGPLASFRDFRRAQVEWHLAKQTGDPARVSKARSFAQRACTYSAFGELPADVQKMFKRELEYLVAQPDQ